MNRLVLLIAPAILICGCNQAADAPQSSADKRGAPTTAEATLVEARINLSPVDPARAKTVMHDRHEGMEQVGKTMKSLARIAKADSVDVAAAQANAAKMNKLAKASANWFYAGTGPDVGKTGAKAEIWQKPADFSAKIQSFQDASAALEAAAMNKNAPAFKAAFGDLGKSCKACHDSYRSKEEH